MKLDQDKIGQLRVKLPSERYKHSLRVAESAVHLAQHYHADVEKVRVAALLHDCSRFLDPKQMLKKAQKLGFKINKIQEEEPKLLHAGLSAYYAEKDFGIKDPEILSAITAHTVGKKNMSLIDKIVYLADHIEGERNYEGVEKVRELAYKDLDRAVSESFAAMANYLKKQGKTVYKNNGQ